MKKLDFENQVATMQITPYRGSAGTMSKNYPIRIWAFKNSGGVNDILPDVNYKDTFMYPYNEKNELGILENFDAPLPTPFMVLASNYFYQNGFSRIGFYEEAEKNPEHLRNGPYNTIIGRLDATLAARKPHLRD